jgi:hypothetical protein
MRQSSAAAVADERPNRAMSENSNHSPRKLTPANGRLAKKI